MRIKRAVTLFVVLSVLTLVVYGVARFLVRFSRPEPSLTVYLSLHDLTTPAGSYLSPKILRRKLSTESMRPWIRYDPAQRRVVNNVLFDIQHYLTVNILSELATDPLVQYTHYYRLEIENESDMIFEGVSVTFPAVKAVEIRRRNVTPEVISPVNDSYPLGEIGPEESVDVYGWLNRPFYVQEENSVVMHHRGGTVRILKLRTVKPGGSWITENILLVLILGGLVLFLTQKMVFVIRTCSKTMRPDLEKRINVE